MEGRRLCVAPGGLGGTFQNAKPPFSSLDSLNPNIWEQALEHGYFFFKAYAGHCLVYKKLQDWSWKGGSAVMSTSAF